MDQSTTKTRRSRVEMQAEREAERNAIKAEVRREVLAEIKQNQHRRMEVSADQMQALLNGRP